MTAQSVPAYPEVESARVETRKITLEFRKSRTEIDSRSNGNIAVTVEFDVKPFMGFSQELHRLFRFELAAQGFSPKDQDEAMGGLFEALEEAALMRVLKATITNRDAQ